MALFGLEFAASGGGPLPLLMLDGAPVFNQAVYTWGVSDGLRMEGVDEEAVPDRDLGEAAEVRDDDVPVEVRAGDERGQREGQRDPRPAARASHQPRSSAPTV